MCFLSKSTAHTVCMCEYFLFALLIINILLLCTQCQSSSYSFLLTELEGDWADWTPGKFFTTVYVSVVSLTALSLQEGKFQSVFYYYILKHTYTEFSYLCIIVHYIIFIY